MALRESYPNIELHLGDAHPTAPPDAARGELTVARRRIHLAAFGEPPDPPATTAFIAALRTALDGRRHS